VITKNHIQVKEVSAEEANCFADQLALQTLKRSRSKAESVFGWGSWIDVSPESGAFVILVNEAPTLAMWLESDAFNSERLQVSQARLHWILGSPKTFSSSDLCAVSAALSDILNQSNFNLVAAHIFGHAPLAAELFQHAAFRMVMGNAWLYRWPIKPLKIGTTPKNTSFEFRNLNERPLGDDALGEYLEAARESFFADRFSLDLNFDEVLVRQRFLSIVENGLRGEIADYAVTARSKSGIEAFAFFAVKKLPDPNLYPQAGKWLTLIARASQRAQGIAHFVIADAIRRLPEGKANWMCTCALDNLGSLRTAQKMGFQIGAIVYDLHRWRESGISD
jgi:hypothetical protein